MNMPRFSEPRDEPETPKRQGTFILEECWLGFENGDFKIFAKQNLASTPIKLSYFYTIDRGDSEPFIRRIFLGNDEIPFSDRTIFLNLAAERFLGDPEIAPQFARWVEEKSEEVPPIEINVFLAEAHRAREAA